MRLFALLAALALALPAAAQQRVVNVYNWTDYIDPYAVQQFQAETGIRVRYDSYDSLETLEAKLLAGKSGYDVVVPTSEPSFSRLVRAGALQRLDAAKIPNLSGLDPALMARVASSDPQGGHGAIYLWGTIGLAVNTAKLKQFAPEAPTDSWDLLLKPDYAKLMARCGIAMIDSAIDVIPTVLKYLGRSPDSTSPEDLALVEKTLKAIRPHIRSFSSAGMIETLASGETCLAIAYSGDAIQAAGRAAEAKRGVEIRYIAPKEGAQLWFDLFAIPADAPNVAEAHAFIDFMLRPKVIAGVTNHVNYPNAVPASLPMVEPAIRDDPGVYPPPAIQAGFFTIGPVPAEAARQRSRMWTRFKTNR
jgi:putrescine transport system substrate-binding protein